MPCLKQQLPAAGRRVICFIPDIILIQGKQWKNHHLKRAGIQRRSLEMIRRWLPPERVPRRALIKDTADFFRVDYDDIVVLGGVPYLVRNNEREGRFGLEDPAETLGQARHRPEDRKGQDFKMGFLEKFTSRIGGLVYECVRSPLKEARILNIVRGRPRLHAGGERLSTLRAIL